MSRCGPQKAVERRSRTKNNAPQEHLYVYDEQLEKVTRYNYLDTNIICTADYCSEIKIRIEKARFWQNEENAL